MELDKLKMDEIRNFESAKIKEVLGDVKEKLLGIRMDVMGAGQKNSGLINGLKRSIARVETAKSERRRKQALASPNKTQSSK